MNDVFWIKGQPATKLAIVMRPRGGDWLDDEMQHFRQNGVETIVSLLEREEAAWLGLAGEWEAAERAGIMFLSYPIPDVHVPPDPAGFREFAAGLAKLLGVGRSIGVHCRGCIGRSTVTAACTLIHLGWKADDALRAIEAARGCPVPDTPEQREWILKYEAAPASQ